MSFEPVMTFPALQALQGFNHGFTLRHPDLDVAVDRAEVLRRLEGWHHQILQEELGINPSQLATAQQVHGNRVTVVDSIPSQPVPESDGLISNQSEVTLAVYVADCCAVFLVDPVGGAFGLLHSGRKGTELGITSVAIQQMQKHLGVDPRNLVVQLSPCIRPPEFEVDFAAQIRAQAHDAGVPASNIHDEGISTAKDLKRFYSYRMEKGKTGRMLAVLGQRRA